MQKPLVSSRDYPFTAGGGTASKCAVSSLSPASKIQNFLQVRGNERGRPVTSPREQMQPEADRSVTHPRGPFQMCEGTNDPESGRYAAPETARRWSPATTRC